MYDVCLCMYAYIDERVLYVCVCVCIHVMHVCMYVCMYLCVYIFMYEHYFVLLAC
jgi:hypothetical protein